MKLPVFLAGLFRNYAAETIDTEKHAGMIIKTVLAYGTWEQIMWLFEYYGVERVRAVFREDYYGLRTLPESARRLWGLVFLNEAPPAEPAAAKWRCRRKVPGDNFWREQSRQTVSGEALPPDEHVAGSN
ncbi:MAG: hypothetical protein AB1510_13360 [Bacillota bacterium]